MPDAAQCVAPTQARRHYLNVNCATNVRKHLIVTIPTASATLCDDELSGYLQVIKDVFFQRNWEITWVAGTSIVASTGNAYHIAIKNTNAHKSTVKSRLLAALSRHRSSKLPAQAHGATSTDAARLLEGMLSPVTVKCRNGEGPLAQHLFPAPSDNDGTVVSVVTRGIDAQKLRNMAHVVRQHRRKRGRAKRGEGGVEGGVAKRPKKSSQLSTCSTPTLIPPLLFEEEPMLVPAGAFQRLQQKFSPVTSFTSNDAPIDEQDLDYSVRSAIVMGAHDEAELGMDLDMATFDDLMQLNVLDEDVAVPLSYSGATAPALYAH